MPWLWVELFSFLSFHILLTVDLYMPWRRSRRGVRMIIVLTRPQRAAARFRLGDGVLYVTSVADPAQMLQELLEIEANGTFTLFIPSIIHASMYTQEATSYKCRQSHGQNPNQYTRYKLTDITKFLHGSTSDSAKTPSLKPLLAHRIFSRPSHDLEM